MYVIQILISVIAIGLVKASNDNDACELNLAQVFRTPKDFSRVNFDHFEILERNNFESAPNSQDSPSNVNEGTPEGCKQPSNSVANAQVMVRFGGDNIHGKNQIDVPEKVAPKPCYIPPIRQLFPPVPPSEIRHPPYCPILPPNHQPPHPNYIPPHSSYCYPYPPYIYPYYPGGPAFRPAPHYQHHVPQHTKYQYGPTQEHSISLEADIRSQKPSLEKDDFLEKEEEKSTTPEIIHPPKILQTEDLSDDIIPEVTCPKCTEKIEEHIEKKGCSHHTNEEPKPCPVKFETGEIEHKSPDPITIIKKCEEITEKEQAKDVIKSSSDPPPTNSTQPTTLDVNLHPSPTVENKETVVCQPHPLPIKCCHEKKIETNCHNLPLDPNHTCHTYPQHKYIHYDNTIDSSSNNPIIKHHCPPRTGLHEKMTEHHFGPLSQICSNNEKIDSPYVPSTIATRIATIATLPITVDVRNFKATDRCSPNIYAKRILTEPEKFSEIESWEKINLPYDCQKCGTQANCLVSYPLTGYPTDIKPLQERERIQISTCPCCQEKGFCDCNSCHRNPNIPYGKRFTTDVDSLLKIKTPESKCVSMDSYKIHPVQKCDQIRLEEQEPQRLWDKFEVRPQSYSTGCSSSCNSEYLSGFSQVDDETPQIYFDGHQTSSGSGYYSDPSVDVFYKKPTVMDLIRKPDSFNPVVEHTKIEYPELYNIVPIYNIVPRNVTTLDIPDLTATNLVLRRCNQVADKCLCHRDMPLPQSADICDVPHYYHRELPYCVCHRDMHLPQSADICDAPHNYHRELPCTQQVSVVEIESPYPRKAPVVEEIVPHYYHRELPCTQQVSVVEIESPCPRKAPIVEEIGLPLPRKLPCIEEVASPTYPNVPFFIPFWKYNPFLKNCHVSGEGVQNVHVVGIPILNEPSITPEVELVKDIVPQVENVKHFHPCDIPYYRRIFRNIYGDKDI